MLSSLISLTALAGTCLAIPPVVATTRAPVVTVKNGSYSGAYNPTYHQDLFLGIPYAQPPVEDLRFRLPQSLNSTWNSIRPAKEYSPFCVGYGGDDFGKNLSEDCLYLSIIRPSKTPPTASLPVAVWIHGGGLRQGGSNDARYNLSFPVQNSVDMGTSMIAVSIQYRLSGWGFLGGKEVLEGGVANLGFRDQRLALHWIQENIEAFGGNPGKVTIWGESAGGQSVGAHLLAYNGRDDKLFTGAIAQSGGPATIFFPATSPPCYNSTIYQTSYNTIVSSTSCGSSPDTLACLRTLPYSVLNTALNSSIPGIGPFPPMIDNDFVATYPSVQLSSGNFVKVPLITGTNTDEGTAFKPPGTFDTDAQFLSALNSTGVSPSSTAGQIIQYLYPNIPAIGIPSFETWPYAPNSTLAVAFGSEIRRLQSYFGDITVNAQRRAANHAWSKFGAPSYSYRFDVTVNGVPPYIGATHFQEVAFVFNNTRGEGYATNPFANTTANFKTLARYMSQSWVSFITTGNPNNHQLEGKAQWPVYDVAAGGGEGSNIVWTVEGSVGGRVEVDDYRAEGIAFINSNTRDVYAR